MIDASLWATERIQTTRPDVGQGLEMPALPDPAERLVLLSPYTGRERLEAERRQDETSALARFIEGCETDTTLRHWESAGLSRRQYQDWRRMLVDSGWAQWKTENPRDGWELTAPAATVCEAMDA